MVDAINSWIKGGCKYTEGVGLYEQHGDNAFQKKVFKQGETAHNRQKLNELLVALRDRGPVVRKSENPEATVVVENIASAKSSTKERILNTPVAAAPPGAEKKPHPELLLVIKQREETYAQLRSYHPLLITTGDGDELRKIADHIVRMGKKNAELWERYNWLTENPDAAQFDTPQPVTPVMIDINLINQRELLRKSLNKAQQRLKNQKPQKQNTIELVNQRKLELSDIDKCIAAITKVNKK